MRDELADRDFYIRLSKSMKDKKFSSDILEFSSIEDKHVNFWKAALTGSGVDVESVKPNRKKIFFLMLIRWVLGSNLAIRLVETTELESIRRYSHYVESIEETPEFKSNLRAIINDEKVHDAVFHEDVAIIEDKLERNRDFIYSMSDGLVEILATVAGLSAVIADHIYIAISGVIVAVGGAMSMTLGAYLSKRGVVDYGLAELRRNREITEAEKEEERIKSRSKKTVKITALSYVLGAAIPVIPFVFVGGIFAVIIAFVSVGIAQGLTNAVAAISVSNKTLGASVRAATLSLAVAGTAFAVGAIFHYALGISIA